MGDPLPPGSHRGEDYGGGVEGKRWLDSGSILNKQFYSKCDFRANSSIVHVI